MRMKQELMRVEEFLMKIVIEKIHFTSPAKNFANIHLETDFNMISTFSYTSSSFSQMKKKKKLPSLN